MNETRIMADLLREGYTMLNLACPICNNPIFKNKKGEKFCPICNRKVIIPEENGSLETLEKQEEKNQKPNIIIWGVLQNSILNKIKNITDRLTEETQMNQIENYINLLSKLIDLFKKIN